MIVIIIKKKKKKKIDRIAFAKKMKSTKINTHIFFCSQSIEFVKNKFPQNPRKTSFAKKKKRKFQRTSAAGVQYHCVKYCNFT